MIPAALRGPLFPLLRGRSISQHHAMRLRTRPVAAAAAAILLTLLASALPAAEPQPEEDAKPEPELTEEIRFRSPNGKYALRIIYDRELNERMTPHNPPENGASGERRDMDEAREGEASGEDEINDGIFSNAMHELAIVSLPGKEIMQDLSDSVFEDGNNFEGLKLLWSSDSKWCAFYHRFPRIGYTSVYHLTGDKFKLAHKPHDLGIDSKGDVRREFIEPMRWVKPGVLQLSIERIYDGDEPSGDTTAFTASFDGRGKWKVLKKKH